MNLQIPRDIKTTDYVGNSLATINNNVDIINNTHTMLLSESNSAYQQSIKLKTGCIYLQKIYSRIAIAKICNIYVSLNNDINHTNQSKQNIFVNPFNGGEIGLFDVNTNTWNLYTLNSILFKSFNNLQRDRIYDVYMFYSEDEGELTTQFIMWPEYSIPTAKTTLDGVDVLSTNFSKRYLGTVYIQPWGTTQSTFNVNNTTKHLVWQNNASNVYISNTNNSQYKLPHILPIKYTNPFIPYGSLKTLWCKTSLHIQYVCGKQSTIKIQYNNTANSNSISKIYSGISIDNTANPNERDQINTQKFNNHTKIYTELIKTVEPGIHNIYAFDACNNSDVTFNVDSNTYSNLTLTVL